MCIQGCRTFLWGGTGNSSHDPAGRCFCVCHDAGWSDVNIMGRASCVPEKAHRIFGWLGLALSLAGICHAAYHLIRQVKFHAQQSMPSILPVERCRRDMHGTAIVAHLFSMSNFVMVIVKELPGSFVMMMASASPHLMCSVVYAGRMWIYTNDPRLMKESPKVIATAAWLERPLSQCVAFVMVSISPCIAAILAAIGMAETSMKVVAGGVALLAAGVGRTFWICGLALIEAIDESLRKRQQQSNRSKPNGTETRRRNGAVSGGGNGADPMLSGAKKKVKHMMIFTTILTLGTFALGLFVVLGEYATAAPLPLYAAPMFLFSASWIAVNIQLHAGRTQLQDSRRGPRLSAPKCVPAGSKPKYEATQVVPFENSVLSP